MAGPDPALGGVRGYDADGPGDNDRRLAVAKRPVTTTFPFLFPTYDRREVAAIFAGGTVGALVRVGVAKAIVVGAHSWPWPTFAVNVAGAFLLGYFVTRLQERLPTSAYKRPFLGTGLCGALTTFSTMQVELFKMVQAREWGLAVGYAGATLVLAFIAVLVATAIVRRVRVVV